MMHYRPQGTVHIVGIKIHQYISTYHLASQTLVLVEPLYENSAIHISSNYI